MGKNSDCKLDVDAVKDRIEAVTQDVLKRHHDLFLRVQQALDEAVKSDPKVKRDFAHKEIETAEFAKDLLSKIVCLYLLQNKGLLGVERDAEWGTGPTDFMRRLFDKKYDGYTNFFNDVCECFFYEALGRDRINDFYSRCNCKIPFVTGDIFAPFKGYDSYFSGFQLPNDIFSNTKKTAQGDLGDGVLDVLDRDILIS